MAERTGRQPHTRRQTHLQQRVQLKVILIFLENVAATGVAGSVDALSLGSAVVLPHTCMEQMRTQGRKMCVGGKPSSNKAGTACMLSHTCEDTA